MQDPEIGIQQSLADFKRLGYSDRNNLEDMHPANIFMEEASDTPICIDCIVKFRR